MLAFSAQRNVEVVAISDEERGTLDSFFAGSSKEFPHTVARDPKRRAFRDYGVSGTPTFVLVDGAGVVQSVSTGYTPKKGLGIPGWTWSRTGS